MRNIIFMTLQYDFAEEKELIKKSKGGVQSAANTYQTEILKGFNECGTEITVLNTVPVGAFPFHCNQLFFRTRDWKMGETECKEIGYINLPVLKQLIRYNKYLSILKKWADETPGEKFVIVYSLYLPFENVIKKLKKLDHKIKVILICTDLPCEYGLLPKNKIKSYLFMKYGAKTLNLASLFDGYILLTEQMKDPLQIKEKPYVILEGISGKGQDKSYEKFKEIVILYTGTLNFAFGIEKLIEAFKLIDNKNYKLIICGGGEAEKYIREQQELDNRIEFLGYQPKDKIIELQNKAWLLVNPRTNNGLYTKYSFPSKTIEYMKSGTPVLMFKLDGIPDEYDQYLLYFKDENIANMAKRIMEICEMREEELIGIGQRAKEFVENNKCGKVQAKKILHLMETI